MKKGHNLTPQDVAELIKRSKKGVVIPHTNADPDAIASAYAISVAFPQVEIVLPEGANKQAKVIMEKLGIKPADAGAGTISLEDAVEDSDIIISVDSSSPEMLGALGFVSHLEDIIEGKKTLLVIDHHVLTEEWANSGEGVVLFVDEKKASCSEMVYEIIKHGAEEAYRDKKVGLALLAGIISDTVSLRYASADTLRTAAEIIEQTGAAMEDAHRLGFSSERDFSEKIANIKAAQRCRILTVNNYVILGTHVSAFESSAARFLMTLGGDVVFVGSQKKYEVRVSGRAKRRAIEAGVNLGKIMENVARETGGSGGGHDGAAGLKTTGDVEAVVHICMEKTREILEASKKENKKQKDKRKDRHGVI